MAPPRNNDVQQKWGFWEALGVLVAARAVAAAFSTISDCDETYNYWEPTHFLMHGEGFQTWEYSPQFAIRSYAYLWLHAAVGFAVELLTSNKILVFYSIRGALALFSAFCEAHFLQGIARVSRGQFVPLVTLGFLVFGTGMFISSSAFLPSSFAMSLCTLSFGLWMQGRLKGAVGCIAISTLLAWPFSAALGIPLALHVLLASGLLTAIGWGLLWLGLVLPPIMLIDSLYYGHVVCAPLNILLYNVFSSNTSSQLYGTEPWYFYLLNLSLNFNLALPLALSAPLFLLLASFRDRSHLWSLFRIAPLFIWLAIFTLEPHKEERFMFPIYPLLCFSAALALSLLTAATGFVCGKIGLPAKLSLLLPLLSLLLFSTISLSRSAAIVSGYGAPLSVYSHLSSVPGVRVCVGKEWYRFPSSFFLPNGTSLHFLESEFRGQLPAKFDPGYGTSRAPPHFNDMNREELSRYVDVSSCDYIIDLSSLHPAPREPAYASLPSYQSVVCEPFLNAAVTPNPDRSLYLPWRRERVKMLEYCLLKRVQ